MATTFYVAVKDDKIIRAEGRLDADGVVFFRNRGKWMPVVIAARAKAEGLDPVAVVNAGGPRHLLATLGTNGGAVEILPAEEYDARETAAAAERAAAHAARLEFLMPGLAALRSARDERDVYDDRFRRMMEDEHNDGARPPTAPRTDAAALARQYPRAALYLRAEAYAGAANHHKSGAGREAMRVLESGGAADVAEDILKNWLPPERFWD